MHYIILDALRDHHWEESSIPAQLEPIETFRFGNLLGIKSSQWFSGPKQIQHIMECFNSINSINNTKLGPPGSLQP